VYSNDTELRLLQAYGCDKVGVEVSVMTDKDNIYNVRKMLSSIDLKASKAMGQNFLVDSAIPEKMVRLSGINGKCGVLEVGPGLGALTLQLCKDAGHVVAVELDKRLIPILRDTFVGYNNIDLVQGDILKVDIKRLVGGTMLGFNLHVCANLPYNITTPALTRFIEAGVFESISVMVQKEVAERICAKPGTAEYGAFTVFVNYYTMPSILFDVPPECFSPRPNVTSSVVKLITNPKRMLSPESEKLFFRVVRAAFGQRRKTLVNALHAAFGDTHSKESITKAVTACGFDARIRGEVLSIKDFAAVSAQL
jgi:16S rRNA (adenine1518-N6/adenine1519-N6)-dimethyltransferase